MLYDKRWDAKVKADPFSLESLIAWLEKQNPAKRYDYIDSSNCVIAQYLKACGAAEYDLAPSELERLGWLDIARWGSEPETFGAALARARAELAKQAASTAGERR